jgi:beta-glucosidase
MDADKGIRGGSDAMLGTAGNDAILTDQTSATSVKAMRQATKNVLYTVVNSNAYTDENYEAAHATPGWMKLLYGVDAVIIIILLVLEIAVVLGYRRKKEATVKVE